MREIIKDGAYVVLCTVIAIIFGHNLAVRFDSVFIGIVIGVFSFFGIFNAGLWIMAAAAVAYRAIADKFRSHG